MPTTSETRECPLCGERMRKKEFETAEKIPGTAEVKRLRVCEWVCPECEYFEEVEEEGRG
jgi:hypothetical protein